jgi:hypothetical protein
MTAAGSPLVVNGVDRHAAVSEASGRDATAAGARIAHFDFVKGTLVLLMVLYHWLNYYIGLQWGGYRYLRFLTPSFIFITGFLVSHVYLKKYSYDDPRLHRRLVWRGLKLLLVFIGLNVLIEFTLGGRLGLRSLDPSTLLAAADLVFVKGNGLAAFDILVSIAYFLLLVPVVLLVSTRLRIPLPALSAVAVIAVAILGATGRSSAHLEMLSIASVGLAAGAYRHLRIGAALRAPALIGPLYLIYLAAITWWNTPFLVQVVGVCLSLLLIDAIAIAAGADGVIQRRIIQLGQYSLFSYIAQIAALQVLRRIFWGLPLLGSGSFIPLLLALAMTVVACELTARLRARSSFVEQAYRAVFV